MSLPEPVRTAIHHALQSLRDKDPITPVDTHRVEHEMIKNHAAAFGDGLVHFTDGFEYPLQEFSRRIGLYLLDHCSESVVKVDTVVSQNLAGQPSQNALWQFV